ncbi:MAG: hypothetical protein GPOALKHO_001032 [Sodalis sp.]|nr:MAG: hypothetical protein GPOALKHO_001032 [Sodalis sp.]
MAIYRLVERIETDFCLGDIRRELLNASIPRSIIKDINIDAALHLICIDASPHELQAIAQDC